eukprot:4409453-Alexandrium_andersonii.AAC.1
MRDAVLAHTPIAFSSRLGQGSFPTGLQAEQAEQVDCLSCECMALGSERPRPQAKPVLSGRASEGSWFGRALKP